MRRLYRESDVFILPSITADDGDMEGVPVVLMEAMACGLPVVSTSHSGIGELVGCGKTGVLAEEKDAAGLAEKLMSVIEDAEYSDSSELGRSKVEREFNVSVLNRELVNIFDSLLSA